MMTLVDQSNQLCVPLEDVKAHLRLDSLEEDVYLERLIRAATQWVESYLEQSLLPKTWKLLCKAAGDRLFLPQGPLMEVRSVAHLLPSGKRHELTRFRILQTRSIPEVLLGAPVTEGDVEIVFVTGFAVTPEQLPADLRQAIIQHVTCIYEERNGISRDQLFSLYTILHPYRLTRLL